MINININGKDIKVESGKTVLEAALEEGIYIPNLCYHPDIKPVGACRMCIVEIDGMRGLPTACTTKVQDGMVVRTDTPEIKELRKNLIWLILSEYPDNIDKTSQLQKVVDWVGVKDLLPEFTPRKKDRPVLTDDPLYIRDLSRCILCGRCVRMCQEVRGIGAIGLLNRGIDSIVGSSYGVPMRDSGCKFCMACVEVCPSGALVDKKKFEEAEREKAILPCKNTCPAGIDIPRYVRLIAEGKYQDALEVIREKVPFPHVLGCVCNHPCEEACKREDVNRAIAIRDLKRFVAERDTGRWRDKLELKPDTGKKVAVIGSGPAGMTAAWYLRKAGHTVTVFEALPETGGMLRVGIPRYRLPAEVLDKEIKYIEDIGVNIKTNSEITSLDTLFDQGYDAVFAGLGAIGATKLGVPGEDDSRVLDGVFMLRDVSLGKKVDITGTVAVVGGGNVAIDVARTSLRIGADKVIILYRRTREEMPAADEEIVDALEENVEIQFLTAPVRVLAKAEKLEIECIKMELGEPDASGRRRPVPIKGSEFIVEVDRLVAAIGQKSIIPEGYDIEKDKWGNIAVDDEFSLACTKKGVFSGGDIVTGPATVIEAIEAGRRAAASIDKYLGGDGVIDQKFLPDEEDNPYLGREEGFAYRERSQKDLLDVANRVKDFSQVECVYSESDAVKEAERCLQCQLRLQIAKMPYPPEE